MKKTAISGVFVIVMLLSGCESIEKKEAEEKERIAHSIEAQIGSLKSVIEHREHDLKEYKQLLSKTTDDYDRQELQERIISTQKNIELGQEHIKDMTNELKKFQ
jgi:transposase